MTDILIESSPANIPFNNPIHDLNKHTHFCFYWSQLSINNQPCVLNTPEEPPLVMPRVLLASFVIFSNMSPSTTSFLFNQTIVWKPAQFQWYTTKRGSMSVPAPNNESGGTEQNTAAWNGTRKTNCCLSLSGSRIVSLIHQWCNVIVEWTPNG